MGLEKLVRDNFIPSDRALSDMARGYAEKQRKENFEKAKTAELKAFRDVSWLKINLMLPVMLYLIGNIEYSTIPIRVKKIHYYERRSIYVSLFQPRKTRMQSNPMGFVGISRQRVYKKYLPAIITGNAETMKQHNAATIKLRDSIANKRVIP